MTELTAFSHKSTVFGSSNRDHGLKGERSTLLWGKNRRRKARTFSIAMTELLTLHRSPQFSIHGQKLRSSNITGLNYVMLSILSIVINIKAELRVRMLLNVVENLKQRGQHTILLLTTLQYVDDFCREVRIRAIIPEVKGPCYDRPSRSLFTSASLPRMSVSPKHRTDLMHYDVTSPNARKEFWFLATRNKIPCALQGLLYKKTIKARVDCHTNLLLLLTSKSKSGTLMSSSGVPKHS